jgi:rhodanese-related sulfurtransferase
MYSNSWLMKFAIVAAILVIIIIIYMAVPGNGQVQSKAYNVMLKSLLAHSVDEIGVAEIPDESILLDARAQSEYDVSHLKNAIWVGYDSFNISRVPHTISKDEPIYVYCSIGYRSEKIGEKLLAAGYSKVYNVYGGLFEWVNQDGEVFNSEGQTKEVHAFDRKWGIWLKKGDKVYE